jgi:hypothetical protein
LWSPRRFEPESAKHEVRRARVGAPRLRRTEILRDAVQQDPTARIAQQRTEHRTKSGEYLRHVVQLEAIRVTPEGMAASCDGATRGERPKVDDEVAHNGVSDGRLAPASGNRLRPAPRRVHGTRELLGEIGGHTHLFQ